MAALLAPYNNAMRLGQGFNSYTQQICLTDAVKPLPKKADEGVSQQDVSTTSDEKPKDGISQIVSYSSRFVDKLSDVTATIGGSASGSFVDSDKFKTSDLNFFIQVRVTNQTTMAKDYTDFTKLDIDATRFTEVYGDTFISGFEEGGELNALISVRVSDKSKTFKVKAELEASLGTPALSGQVKGAIDLEKSKVETSTETTVTVNWSGGGKIKKSDVLWDINSLTLAAANFPDLVARTPQRTYAILTKYSSLPSFHQKMKSFTALDYENAGIYTSALLDSYMDYKSIWKQIQLANFELQNQRADMIEAKPVQEVLSMAEIDGENFSIEPPPKTLAASDSTETVAAVKKFVPAKFEFKPFKATVLGLDSARLACRQEMIKIVKEVDQVTKDPDVALDPSRMKYFVSSSVFKALLPVVTLRPVEVDAGDKATPPMSCILGISEDSKPKDLYTGNTPLYSAARLSAEKHRRLAHAWSMGELWAGSPDPGPVTSFFNDMDVVNPTWMISKIVVYYSSKWLTGILIRYTNDREILHGQRSGDFTKEFSLSSDGQDKIVRLGIRSSTTDLWRVDGICFYFAQSSLFFIQTETTGNSSRWEYFGPPSTAHWSFRGFWGNLNENDRFLSTLGCAWAMEKQPSWLLKPSDTRGQLLPSTINAPKALRELALKYKDRGVNLVFSDFIGTQGEVEGEEFWTHLDDSLKPDWKTKTIRSYRAGNSCLSGLKITDANGNESLKPQGGSNEESVDLSVKAVKFVRSKVDDGTYVNSVYVYSSPNLSGTTEKVRGEDLLRYTHTNDYAKWLGTKVGEEVDQLVIFAPDYSWQLTGFYGYSDKKAITRLGVIWGKM